MTFYKSQLFLHKALVSREYIFDIHTCKRTIIIGATIKKKDHPKSPVSNLATVIIIDTKPRSPTTQYQFKLHENKSFSKT